MARYTVELIHENGVGHGSIEVEAPGPVEAQELAQRQLNYREQPILPGLPCPTCRGKRWLRAPAPYDEVLPGRSCPDCTDGVWTPPGRAVRVDRGQRPDPELRS